MESLNLPVIQQQGELKQAVNARELHIYLQSRQQFSDWIKSRIEKYDFIENQDYICISENYETQRANGQRGIATRKEYYISIDMAKELSMVENNEQGKTARKYFIECEKQDKNQAAEQAKRERELREEDELFNRELSRLGFGVMVWSGE